MAAKRKTRLKPPEEIEGEALLEWHRITAELRAIGRLEKVDRSLLVLYVQEWSVHHEAARVVAREGPVKEHSNGTVGPHPARQVMKDAAAQLRRMLNDMELTPATRKSSAVVEELDDLKM
jgi:P27 family predicted phage terminase small subunit